MDCSHLCKQHYLECVNITPDTVNNSMKLGFSFLFHFEASQLHTYNTNINERTQSTNLVIKKHQRLRLCVLSYNSCVPIKLPSLKLQGTSKHVCIIDIGGHVVPFNALYYPCLYRGVSLKIFKTVEALSCINTALSFVLCFISILAMSLMLYFM